MSETTNPLGLSSIPSVSSEGLVPVGRRTSLSSYLAALWNRRHFIIAESRAKMSSSTRKNILGYGWLFLNPLLSVLAFWFIFGLHPADLTRYPTTSSASSSSAFSSSGTQESA